MSRSGTDFPPLNRVVRIRRRNLTICILAIASFVFVSCGPVPAASPPAPTELAKKIQSRFRGLPGLHVKWKVATEINRDLTGDDSPRMANTCKHDEYAAEGKKQLRRCRTPFYGNPSMVREGTFILRDDVLHWREVDFESSSPSTPVSEPTYNITSSQGDMWHSLYDRALYLECIGSPFHDGKSLGVWRLHRYHGDVPESDFKTPRAFSITEALHSGEYKVRPNMEVVDGIECWAVESPGLDTVWLAPSLGLAMVRREWNWFQHGPVMCRYLNSDFKEVSAGFFLPRTATRETMVNTERHAGIAPGTTHFAHTAQLTSAIVGELADSLFSHAPSPGTYVVDDTLGVAGGPASVAYKWGETAEQTAASRKQSLRRLEEKRRADTRAYYFSWTRWIFVVGSVLLVALACAFYYRRRRSLNSSPAS